MGPVGQTMYISHVVVTYLFLDLVQEREAGHVLECGARHDLELELRVLAEVHQRVCPHLGQFWQDVVNHLATGETRTFKQAARADHSSSAESNPESR